jgi:hypothetical protein
MLQVILQLKILRYIFHCIETQYLFYFNTIFIVLKHCSRRVETRRYRIQRLITRYFETQYLFYFNTIFIVLKNHTRRVEKRHQRRLSNRF